MAAGEETFPSMPEWFRQQGYRTVSVGKVSHHPGGRGGPDWNDEAIIEMPERLGRTSLSIGRVATPARIHARIGSR